MDQQPGMNVSVEKVIDKYQKRIAELTHLNVIYETHIEMLQEQIEGFQTATSDEEAATSEASPAKAKVARS